MSPHHPLRQNPKNAQARFREPDGGSFSQEKPWGYCELRLVFSELRVRLILKANQPKKLNIFIDFTFCQLLKIELLNDIFCRNKIIAQTNSRLLLGEAPTAVGDEGTPRTLCSHLRFD